MGFLSQVLQLNAVGSQWGKVKAVPCWEKPLPGPPVDPTQDTAHVISDNCGSSGKREVLKVCRPWEGAMLEQGKSGGSNFYELTTVPIHCPPVLLRRGGGGESQNDLN